MSSMCFKRESMLAISRDSFEVSWPMLSRPPINRPPMIQKLLRLAGRHVDGDRHRPIALVVAFQVIPSLLALDHMRVGIDS